jgi:hypothetical protein
MYHPSPNKLCPKCEGERLDKWIAEQEQKQAEADKQKKTEYVKGCK